MAKGPFGLPGPPEPTPLDSAPIRPHRPGVASIPPGCLGGYLHRMRIWDPLAGSCMDMPRPRRYAGW
jgi:hypothetical protein